MNSSKLALHGVRVIEFAGLAPAPYCGKVLSDFGASVLRIDKPKSPALNWLDANKKSIVLDIKKPAAKDIILKLCSSYDVLIDPYRPGVLEKLGLGPSDLLSANPKLIYARLTGYGQTGPLAKAAGHDINYVALSGILSMLGRKENNPTPPINLLADFAGGGLLCAFGIVTALLDRTRTGIGQVVDMSMSEGAAYVGSWMYSSKDSYVWGQPRGENMLDSGTHFYDTYETKDGKYMSVGSIEGQFYDNFLKGLGFQYDQLPQMSDFDEKRNIVADKFKEFDQKHWIEIFNQLDACVAPVLTLEEAPLHPHNVSRKNFRLINDQWEPTPAPRLTDMHGNMSEASMQKLKDNPPCPLVGEHTTTVLKEELKFSEEHINQLLKDGVVRGIESKL